ncbi:MAG: autotransporter domain-containing protein [Gammaproteobacteria bacterium]|nr:autotransporter domain-containing protein [Gammaproteobacteria bacterium]
MTNSVFNQRVLLVSAFVSAWLGCGSATAEVEFSDGIFFGDSLSDSGTYIPLLPPDTGKFTTNPGNVWTENLASFYAVEADPATAGGTNYAQGGARVTDTPGFPNIVPTGTALSVAGQVAAYLGAAGGADPDALFSVWAGSNDIFFQTDQVAIGSITLVMAEANVVTAASNLVAEVGMLEAAGARFILVGNLPDSGATPAGIASGAPDTLTGLTNAFNTALIDGIAAAGLEVIPLDFNGLFAEVLADPSAFGIVDITIPACGLTAALLCTPADLILPGADNAFFFADGVHPTTAGHRITADYAVSIIEAPQAYSMLAETPVKLRDLLTRALDQRLTLIRPERDRISSFVNADYSTVKYSRGADSPGLKPQYAGITVGGDILINNNWIAGGALTYNRTDASFSDERGEFEANEATLSAFAGYRIGAGYINAIAGFGWIDYPDIQRNIKIGALEREAQADTSGRNYSLALSGGYQFSHRAFNHGPFARALAQRIKVDAFDETGGGSAGLGMEDQDRDSLILTAGYGIRFHGETYSPYLVASYDHDREAKDRDVGARVLSFDAMRFDMRAYVPDDSYATVIAGYNVWFGAKYSADFRYTGTFGQSDVNAHSFLASFAARF